MWKTFYHSDEALRKADGSRISAVRASAAQSARTGGKTSTTRHRYVSVKIKFSIAVLAAVLWAAVSTYLAQPWLAELSSHIGFPLASLVIVGIAIVPGFMNAFLLASLALDSRPKRVPLERYPSITILIAAYNEAATIVDTIKSIDRQHYSGELEVIVINDGSTDATASLVAAELANCSWLKLIDLRRNGGKAKALNQGLAQARHGLVVTVDADSYLYRDALQSVVERYVQDPPDTRVVAGTVLVRNSRESWIARAQEWDYFHGISAIKRVQSLFQGTLVAQGAFSLYDRDTLIAIGGWPDCVGEDIVLTWAILKAGYRVGHSEDACLFTNAPSTLAQFSRQRQRWSRGMIEAFKQHPDILLNPRLSTFFVYWNLLFPLLDSVFTLAFIPGLVLALFGNFWIVGPITLALIPMAMAMNYFMFSIGRKMFDERGLRVRHNLPGFLIYTIAYSLIMQPICVVGYFSEILNLKKTWGTK
jgi:biofilm PGA synthesis N-glycosyltransferase PgaC